MRVSGFSYVRNGLIFGYPFAEAIRSILPLCDEFIMVVGDSTDGTRSVIESINSPKIRIIDTVWDENLRKGGFIFSQQANIGLDHCTGDWCFHIQADEVVHENGLPVIRQAMQNYFHDLQVEGFLLHFLNFFGDYNHVAPSRRYHNKEIRVVRNDKNIRSYKDSQGFRRFENPGNYLAEKGKKLLVKQIDATLFHYSYVKKPHVQTRKQIEFGKRWHDDATLTQAVEEAKTSDYDYSCKIDVLEKFTGTHPEVMKEQIKNADWKFNFDPSKNNMTLKEKLLYFIQRTTGKQLFAYKNYRLL
jgi:glycosyltransferase involved in cell wall biosynthesis